MTDDLIQKTWNEAADRIEALEAQSKAFAALAAERTVERDRERTRAEKAERMVAALRKLFGNHDAFNHDTDAESRDCEICRALADTQATAAAHDARTRRKAEEQRDEWKQSFLRLAAAACAAGIGTLEEHDIRVRREAIEEAAQKCDEQAAEHDRASSKSPADGETVLEYQARMRAVEARECAYAVRALLPTDPAPDPILGNPETNHADPPTEEQKRRLLGFIGILGDAAPDPLGIPCPKCGVIMDWFDDDGQSGRMADFHCPACLAVPEKGR